MSHDDPDTDLDLYCYEELHNPGQCVCHTEGGFLFNEQTLSDLISGDIRLCGTECEPRPPHWDLWPVKARKSWTLLAELTKTGAKPGTREMGVAIVSYACHNLDSGMLDRALSLGAGLTSDLEFPSGTYMQLAVRHAEHDYLGVCGFEPADGVAHILCVLAKHGMKVLSVAANGHNFWVYEALLRGYETVVVHAVYFGCESAYFAEGRDAAPCVRKITEEDWNVSLRRSVERGLKARRDEEPTLEAWIERTRDRMYSTADFPMLEC